MRNQLRALSLAVGLLLANGAFAQSPGTGMTTRPATKSTVQNPMTAGQDAPPAPAGKSMEVPKTGMKSARQKPETAAPGGGDGKVWVNTASKTYHCPGTKYYGKTKAGEFMSEAEAKAKGNHADHKKACS